MLGRAPSELLAGAAKISTRTNQENTVVTSIKILACRICDEEEDQKKKRQKKGKMMKMFGVHDDHEY
jgi:hypothetical protein